jgi:uncharacterized protein
MADPPLLGLAADPQLARKLIVGQEPTNVTGLAIEAGLHLAPSLELGPHRTTPFRSMNGSTNLPGSDGPTRTRERAAEPDANIATHTRTPSVCDAGGMEQRISLVTLGVTDLSRARSFYEALGWSGAQQPDAEVCFFQRVGWFSACRFGSAVTAPGHRTGSQCPLPQEVTAVLAEAERAGGTIVRPAARAEWGGTPGAFADPDGYVWEVAHNPDWSLAEDGTIKDLTPQPHTKEVPRTKPSAAEVAPAPMAGSEGSSR